MCVECYLAVVHPVTFLKYKPLRYRVICCTVVWIIGLGSCLSCTFTIVLCNFLYLCMLLLTTVLSLPLHPVVLSCSCSQSSEAVRTRRERESERGGKPHQEKIILPHSHNYGEHGYHILYVPLFYLRIVFHSDSTLFSGTFYCCFLYTYIYWLFCSACSLSEPHRKTLLLSIKNVFSFFFVLCYILVFYILQFSDAALVASDLYLQCEVAQVMFV